MTRFKSFLFDCLVLIVGLFVIAAVLNKIEKVDEQRLQINATKKATQCDRQATAQQEKVLRNQAALMTGIK